MFSVRGIDRASTPPTIAGNLATSASLAAPSRLAYRSGPSNDAHVLQVLFIPLRLACTWVKAVTNANRGTTDPLATHQLDHPNSNMWACPVLSSAQQTSLGLPVTPVAPVAPVARNTVTCSKFGWTIPCPMLCRLTWCMSALNLFACRHLLRPRSSDISTRPCAHTGSCHVLLRCLGPTMVFTARVAKNCGKDWRLGFLATTLPFLLVMTAPKQTVLSDVTNHSELPVHRFANSWGHAEFRIINR